MLLMAAIIYLDDYMNNPYGTAEEESLLTAVRMGLVPVCHTSMNQCVVEILWNSPYDHSLVSVAE